MSHPATWPLYFGLLAFGGGGRTSPAPVRPPSHSPQGWQRAREKVCSGGSHLDPRQQCSRSVLCAEQQPSSPGLQDGPGTDIARFSCKERQDDGSKPTRAELPLLPHLPRAFTRHCSGRVGTKGQQKRPGGVFTGCLQGSP